MLCSFMHGDRQNAWLMCRFVLCRDSGKCTASKRDCHYSSDRGAVKDQRVQQNVVPGMWIWQIAKFNTMDPFDAFPVEMKLRSRELFYYCMCKVPTGSMDVWPALSANLARIKVS
jgi:hypothetical protein